MPGVSSAAIPLNEALGKDDECPESAVCSGDDRQYVLIADDDEVVYRIIRQSLEETGDFQIGWVKDGFEALEACEKQTPDLILLDVSMPKMDGIEFIQIFRKRPEAKAVPILLVSSFDDIADRVRGLDLGAVDLVSKPFRPLELAIRTKRHLEMRQLFKEVSRQRQEIAEEAGTLEAILNSSPSGMAVLDRRLRILRHNNQFASLFPASGGSLIDVDVSTICRR